MQWAYRLDVILVRFGGDLEMYGIVCLVGVVLIFRVEHRTWCPRGRVGRVTIHRSDLLWQKFGWRESEAAV